MSEDYVIKWCKLTEKNLCMWNLKCMISNIEFIFETLLRLNLCFLNLKGNSSD